MTRREAHEAHIKLWTWLKENPGKGKEDWPEWDFNGGGYPLVDSHCFACKVADRNEYGCSRCPIKWTGGRSCLFETGEYALWVNSETDRARKHLAAKIAAMWPEEKE